MATCVCEGAESSVSTRNDLSEGNSLKQLYDKRLKELEKCKDSPNFDQLKVKFLTYWVKDLEEQNAFLVETIQEMCHQIEKIQEKACACCECNSKELAANKEELEKRSTLIEKLQAEIRCLKSACNDRKDCETKKLRECLQQKDCQILALIKRIKELREDIQKKTCTVTQLLARNTADACCMTEDSGCSLESSSSDSKCYEADLASVRGKTSASCPKDQCELQKCLEKQLEEAEAFLHKAVRDKECLTDEVTVLNKQLCAQNMKIINLTKRLSESEKTSRDMQSALTLEVSNKHNIIMMLRQNNFELQDSSRRIDLQCHFKDDVIRELRRELKQARKKMCMMQQDLMEVRQDRGFEPPCPGTRPRALTHPAWYASGE